MLYIAGQIAWDKDARIVSPDFATQFLQALDNVIAVVREAGGATEHIVKLLAFVDRSRRVPRRDRARSARAGAGASASTTPR